MRSEECNRTNIVAHSSLLTPHFFFSRDPRSASCDNSGMPKLTPIQIRQSLRHVPRWRKTGRVIRRTYEFKDFVVAMKFVNAAARAAEKACHHPDIDIRWNKVTLALTTHDQGGLTEKDFELAARFDALA